MPAFSPVKFIAVAAALPLWYAAHGLPHDTKVGTAVLVWMQACGVGLMAMVLAFLRWRPLAAAGGVLFVLDMAHPIPLHRPVGACGLVCTGWGSLSLVVALAAWALACFAIEPDPTPRLSWGVDAGAGSG